MMNNRAKIVRTPDEDTTINGGQDIEAEETLQEEEREHARENAGWWGVFTGVTTGIITDMVIAIPVGFTTGFEGWHFTATLGLFLGIPVGFTFVSTVVALHIAEKIYPTNAEIPEISLDNQPFPSSTKKLANFFGCCLGNRKEAVPVVTVQTELVTDNDLFSENQFENVRENGLRLR